jgi:hypothetical protein
MINVARNTRVRALLVAMTLVVASLGSPALAATTTPFGASFAERTTFLVCPLGAPLGAVCFRGEGDGRAMPPGEPARHTFTGQVAPDPSVRCPDRLTSRSTATIVTRQGNLDLVAQGSQCPPPVGETGTWRATGGTGVFAGAGGGGSYATTDVVVNPDGTISSTTTYSGTLTRPGQ